MTSIELAAKSAEDRVLELFRDMGLSWVKLAKEIVSFQDKKYYEALGFHSFNAWLQAKGLGKLSRSSIYRYMGIYRKLEERIPAKELEKITQVNALKLLKIPESKRNGELLLEAQNQSEGQFSETIKRKFGDLHIENKIRRGWIVEESLADLIDRVIELAKSTEDLELDVEAVEAIFSSYEQAHQA